VANLHWRTAQEEDRQNEELLKLAQQEILELTKEIHSSTFAPSLRVLISG
jgi:predicted metal-dependent hydrolase